MHESTPALLSALRALCQQAGRQAQSAAQRAAQRGRKDVTTGDAKALTVALAKILVLANCLVATGVIDADRFFQTSQTLRAKPGWLRMKRSHASLAQRGA
ncbi:hypothetical protein [Asaia sp. HN010]|uniref:hypothetical protein n=1 Tax=Asaia sp. HN010 TaxID=3081233 RepID=UPI0030171C78